MLAEKLETRRLAFEGDVDGTVGFRVEIEIEGVGDVARLASGKEQRLNSFVGVNERLYKR